MSNIMEMGSTARHRRLLEYAAKSINGLFERKELIHFSESASLVYTGNKKHPESCSLIDLKSIDNKSEFMEEILNDLELVTPDYMHFVKDNDFLINKNETRVVGKPDLIIEVWSKSNGLYDREFIKYLYAASSITEHWYIEQHSNIVECWVGDKRTEDKNLSDALKTKDNIEFDLRYLKL